VSGFNVLLTAKTDANHNGEPIELKLTGEAQSRDVKKENWAQCWLGGIDNLIYGISSWKPGQKDNKRKLYGEEFIRVSKFINSRIIRQKKLQQKTKIQKNKYPQHNSQNVNKSTNTA